MNQQWQTLIASALVLCAVGYTGWICMPARWRQSLGRWWWGAALKQPLQQQDCRSGCQACAVCPASLARPLLQIRPSVDVDALSSGDAQHPR